MLERAKACLQSGARETLRSRSKTPRSRRTLHCDFWNIGAPALDCPPWLASSSPCVDGTLVDHNAKHGHVTRQDQEDVANIGPSGFETPFLDFLYPQQALALLRRHARAGQQWERWEKRNARRLPDGFVQASRGYASRSEGKTHPTKYRSTREDTSAGIKLSEGKRQQNTRKFEERHKDEGQGVATSSDAVSHDDATAMNLGTTSIVERRSAHHDTNLPHRDHTHLTRREDDSWTPQHEQVQIRNDPTSEDPHIEPGVAGSESTIYRTHSGPDFQGAANDTLKAEDVEDSPYTLLQSLQRIMATTRFLPSHDHRADQHKIERLVDRVLELYEKLPKEIQVGTRLKLALIEWLAPFHYSVAEDKCVSLYESCRSVDVTIAGYIAVMVVLMRRHLFPTLAKLHEDALQWLPNSQQVSSKYFEYAVMEQRWDLALSIVKRLQGTARPETTSAVEAMLWVNLSNIPALLAKAFDLSKYTQRVRNARDPDPALDSFCSKFCKEALTQEFDAKGSSGLPPAFNAVTLRQKFVTKDLSKVIAQLRFLPGEDTAKTLNSLLMALLQDNARYQFRSVYWLVSYLYHMLRKQESYLVPEQTLRLILKHLTAHLITSDNQGGSTTSLSISRLTDDWIRHYGKLEWSALKYVLEFYALAGRPDMVDYWMKYMKTPYDSYSALAEVQWTAIRAHAQRTDVAAAQDTFDDAKARAKDHGRTLDVRCWNSLLLAYSRADQVDACLKILQMMIDENIRADEASFLAVLIVLGKRGDVGAVRNLMSQYADLTDEKPPIQFYASLISAHVKCRDLSKAEDVLHAVFDEVSSGRLQGSLTWPCNTILMAHAARKDVDNTMRIYEWMKTHQIRPDERTFAAIMQALAHHAQTNAAWKLLRLVMPEQRSRSNAMHYAIIMRGYLQQGMIEEALMVHDHMTTQNIKSSNATNTVYLEAKAKFENIVTSPAQATRARGALRWRVQRPDDFDLELRSNPGSALIESIEDMKKILRDSHGRESVGPDPGVAGSVDSSSSLFGTLIYVHGKRGCFEAVHELYNQYQQQRKDVGNTSKDPIVIVEALMDASMGAGDFDEVEKYWSLAKEQADEIARPMNVAVPDLLKRKRHHQRSSADDMSSSTPPETSVTHTEQPRHVSADTVADVAAVGFDSSGPPISAINNRSRSSSGSTPESNAIARPAAGKAHLLSGPLRLYLGALAAQNRIMDIVNTFSEVLNQGYQMDIRTWNTFIEKLCLASPPLTLLAYVLTERYLTPQFPGWVSTRSQGVPPYTARSQGLQYIRARFLSPGLLMPQYSTFVYLGAALLKLRHMENTGELAAETLGPSARYVGSLKQVRSLAPKTLYAVQSMPAQNMDPLQAKVLRREA